MNIKLTFSYDGSRFNGSQMQPEKNTVADAFLLLFNSMGIKSQLVLSGRTDKNVHATGQVANIKLPYFWKDTTKLFQILSKHLPSTIKLHSLIEVNDDFNARYSAKRRIYRYVFTNTQINPFNQAYITKFDGIIDENIINQTIKEFIGIYDFEYFSKKGSAPTTTIREIYSIKFYKYKDTYILKFKANAFLRSQIRMMVQMIFKILNGSLTIENLRNQLQKKEQKLKTLAPANGLYLTKIIY
jgi:tRNA pseudouridine38-40 synthase